MRSFSTTDKAPKPTLYFELDGRQFAFTTPSWAPFLLSVDELDPNDPRSVGVAMRKMLDWLGSGLSDVDGEFILSRLQDEKDPFDLDDAIAIVFGLIEEATGRPITPSSVSSESRVPTRSTDGRHLADSNRLSSAFADSAILPTTT